MGAKRGGENREKVKVTEKNEKQWEEGEVETTLVSHYNANISVECILCTWQRDGASWRERKIFVSSFCPSCTRSCLVKLGIAKVTVSFFFASFPVAACPSHYLRLFFPFSAVFALSITNRVKKWRWEQETDGDRICWHLCGLFFMGGG